MMLTLFCDASHCGQTRAAGWGAWAKRDGWKFGKLFGGAIVGSPANSTEAELAGIAQAIADLVASSDLDGVKTIMVQCDNIAALAAIRTLPQTTWSRSDDRRDASGTGQRRVLSPFERRALEQIGDLIAGRTTLLRHVKGHSSGTGRNWVNQQCDFRAKRFMKEGRRSRSHFEAVAS